jgi:hypothetical protein
LPGTRPKTPADLDSEVSIPPPIARSQMNGRNPLSGLGSPTEFHPYTTVNASTTEAAATIHPFQGFLPYSVLPAEQSHIPPTDPIPPVTLRPQGLSPSRRFAPRSACRACSIPVPLLGFPLQGVHPTAAPYVLSNAGSLRVSCLATQLGPPFQGFTHATPSPETNPRFRRDPPSGAFLGLCSSEV